MYDGSEVPDAPFTSNRARQGETPNLYSTKTGTLLDILQPERRTD